MIKVPPDFKMLPLYMLFISPLHTRETRNDTAFRSKNLHPQVVGEFYLMENRSLAFHSDQFLNC